MIFHSWVQSSFTYFLKLLFVCYHRNVQKTNSISLQSAFTHWWSLFCPSVFSFSADECSVVHFFKKFKVNYFRLVCTVWLIFKLYSSLMEILHAFSLIFYFFLAHPKSQSSSKYQRKALLRTVLSGIHSQLPPCLQQTKRPVNVPLTG